MWTTLTSMQQTCSKTSILCGMWTRWQCYLFNLMLPETSISLMKMFSSFFNGHLYRQEYYHAKRKLNRYIPTSYRMLNLMKLAAAHQSLSYQFDFLSVYTTKITYHRRDSKRLYYMSTLTLLLVPQSDSLPIASSKRCKIWVRIFYTEHCEELKALDLLAKCCNSANLTVWNMIFIQALLSIAELHHRTRTFSLFKARRSHTSQHKFLINKIRQSHSMSSWSAW